MQMLDIYEIKLNERADLCNLIFLISVQPNDTTPTVVENTYEE
jgi:hypothetical protein